MEGKEQYVDIPLILDQILNDNTPFEKKVKQSLKKQIENGKISTNLGAIIFALDALYSKINISSYQNNFGTFYKFTRHRGLQTSREELMTYGAKIAYSLRQFFNQEQIKFAIGITVRGEYKIAYVSQSDVIKNLSAISGNAIGLTDKIEKKLIEASTEVFDKSMMEQWNKIVSWANTDKIYESGDSEDDFFNKNHVVYKNSQIDTNVFAKFNGNKHLIGKYYKIDSKYVYFNNGWLWQWFLQLAYQTTNGQQIISGMTNLSHFFTHEEFKKDNIKGIKEGDIQKEEDKKIIQIQAKMNNNTIIKFNSILQVIQELKDVLKDYESNISSEKNIECSTIIDTVKNLLMPTATEVSEELQQSIEQLLLKENIGSKK